MRLFTVVVAEGGNDVAIKMRNNKESDSVCCECGMPRNKVLDMFDLCVGGNIFTLCDECNEKLFSKCLSAECYKNGRVKSQHDISIINQRKQRKGLGWYREEQAKLLKGEDK